MTAGSSKPSVTGGYQTLRNSSLSGRLKFLLKDSVLYGSASAMSSLMSLFTVPILTRVFAMGEYGAVDAITVLGAVFIVSIRMGQDAAMALMFYETEDYEERKQIVSEALLTQAALCLVVSLSLFITADSLVAEIINAPQYAGAFRVLVATFPFVTVVFFSRNLLKWIFARRQFILLSLGSTALVIALTLVMVVIFHLGVVGVFYAQLLGMGLWALIGLYFCRDYLVWPHTFQHGRRMLMIGWPYMLIAVVATMIPALDRVFIIHYLNLEAMGLYAVGYKLAFLLMLPVNAFQAAWMPFGLAIYKEVNANETYNKVLVYYVAALSMLAFSLVLLSEPLIIAVASPRYLAGSIVVMPVVFGLIAESTAWISGIGLDLSKKTYFNALSYFIGLTVSTLTIWLLIERWGILGVAYGMMTGRVAQGITYTLFAYKVYHLRFAWKTPLTVLVIAFLLGFAVQAMPFPSVVYHISFRLLLMAVLALVIWKGAVPPHERGFIVREGKAFLSALVNRSRLAWSRG